MNVSVGVAFLDRLRLRAYTAFGCRNVLRLFVQSTFYALEKLPVFPQRCLKCAGGMCLVLAVAVGKLLRFLIAMELRSFLRVFFVKNGGRGSV